ncbi:ABC transporter ATP-binding protein [Fodinicurvata halophila]|uniref:ABC transporter ATP-binding protein n=1 Tax=Fodinicurvata halophila TaxID=1419723 RepID=A0ABV8UI52_9PROT
MSAVASAGFTETVTALALDLRGVSRTFGALVALDDVTLKVQAGERRAVFGANGAGKTTLFNAVTGDFPPTAGRIRFFGEDVTTMPPQERIRRGLRRTYQNSLLFRGLTVFDNLYLAARGVGSGRFSMLRSGEDDATMEAARNMMHAAHLDRLEKTPVSDLAHGQQRQLEIGMALAGAPRLILFDEPAAGLSPAERRELVDILRALPKHIGYVIIEHDLDVALRVVDYCTVMHNGAVFKEGAPDEIEGDPDVQRIYLGGGHE